MTDADYKTELQIAITELRARYTRCHEKYDQLQTKFFALLAGQLTVATLLFSGYFSGNNTIELPSTGSGLVFFFAAVLMLVVAVGISFWSVASNRDWVETPERRRILSNEEIKAHGGNEFLERIKQDYDEAITICDDCYEKRAFRLDWTIRLFVPAVIILLVLKFGGA